MPFATIFFAGFFAGALLSFDKMPAYGNNTAGGGPKVGMTSSLTSHTAPTVDTSALMGATPEATPPNIINVFVHFYQRPLIVNCRRKQGWALPRPARSEAAPGPGLT